MSCPVFPKDRSMWPFVVDARQQAAREWGVMEHLERVEPKLLVAMHTFGKRWLPSYEFLWHYPEQKLWIPEKDGHVKEAESLALAIS